MREDVSGLVQEMKEKVSSLEKALADFIRHTDLGFAKVQNAQIAQQYAMDDFKEEMRQSRERSEKEMQEFKEEMRVFRVEMNKRWGELANRLGTLAEDFVAPNIPWSMRHGWAFTCWP